MVKVQNDLGMLPAKLLGIFYGSLCHIAQKCCVCIVTGTLRHLQDYRRTVLGGSLDDSLKLLHVVEVESGDGIAALDGLGKHLAGVHKTELFITYHFYS